MSAFKRKRKQKLEQRPTGWELLEITMMPIHFTPAEKKSRYMPHQGVREIFRRLRQQGA